MSFFRILENIHTSECSFKIIFIHCSVKMKMLILSENLLRGEQFVLLSQSLSFLFGFFYRKSPNSYNVDRPVTIIVK